MATVSLIPPSFPCLFIVLIFQAAAQPDFKDKLCFDNLGRNSSNSTYEANLKIVPSRLTSNTEIDYCFYNSSYGDSRNKVYATGLCRGDVKPDACRDCITNSYVLLPKHCPYLVQAVGVYDECILHYSDVSVFGVQENLQYWIYWPNDTKAPNWDKYDIMLKDLLEKLKDVAASGDSLRKFAPGNEKELHAFVQCHPDLSEAECKDCLEGAFSYIQTCCAGKTGGRIVVPSCNFRFENYRFYDASVDKTIAATSPQKSAPAPPRLSSHATISHGKNKTLPNAIVNAISAVAFTLLLIFLCVYFIMMK